MQIDPGRAAHPLCHAVEVNCSSDSGALAEGMLALAIDTCGPSGSLALGRLHGGAIEIVATAELEGRMYSATLIGTLGELLAERRMRGEDLGCIVVVNGPGSFTGVRVGLSAAKGLSEGAGIPVIAVSRLAVLARASGLKNAALDAHRHEIFLKMGDEELLASADDLRAIHPCPEEIAVCDDGAAVLLSSVWRSTSLVCVSAPTASDALHASAERLGRGTFDDVLLLDGHYLRRSDAEIFGGSSLAANRER